MEIESNYWNDWKDAIDDLKAWTDREHELQSEKLDFINRMTEEINNAETIDQEHLIKREAYEVLAAYDRLIENTKAHIEKCKDIVKSYQL